MFLLEIQINAYDPMAGFEHVLPGKLEIWAKNFQGILFYYHRCICFRKVAITIKASNRPDQIDDLLGQLKELTRCRKVDASLNEVIESFSIE